MNELESDREHCSVFQQTARSYFRTGLRSDTHPSNVNYSSSTERRRPSRETRLRTPMSSASLARFATIVSITSSSSMTVTCAVFCRHIFNIITKPERISRSTRIPPRRVQYNRQPLARTLPSRRSEVCIIATNDALHELLGRSKWHACFRGRPFPLSNCVARMQRESDLMHGASHPWPIFYSADKQSSLAIFTGKPIPKPI